ncbi:Type IV secretion system protein VirB9 [Paraburkholderia unamae]|uniref:TrbG/VirB9 family P-type conjugative transfer protein n=1 Tax=Paraburkholderia unamae TaxID=219649 RepID=UPI001CB4DC30|nr:Type IV secretion system protein VirB9 [Paraburkholderia unamae]
MTIPATRSLMPLAALVCALAFSQSSLAARKPSFPAPSLDMGAIVGDPMSPVNPYNSGTDPVAMPNDARIVVFEYSRDQIFRVLTAPLKLTTIELAPGEKLTTDPAMGDSVQWLIDTDGANHVFIKPVKQGLVNTLHLTTNMREYDLTLVSSPVGGLFYQSVRFHYAGSLMARMRAKQGVDANEGGGAAAGGNDAGDSGPLGVSPDKLNFDYKVDGSAPFRPETVFDDGKFVWLRLPVDAPFAVPIVKDHGDDVSPNFIRRGQYLVVQQLADRIVLRAADDEVTISRHRRGIFGF